LVLLDTAVLMLSAARRLEHILARMRERAIAVFRDLERAKRSSLRPLARARHGIP
jgi:hypothetical protein